MIILIDFSFTLPLLVYYLPAFISYFVYACQQEITEYEYIHHKKEKKKQDPYIRRKHRAEQKNK